METKTKTSSDEIGEVAIPETDSVVDSTNRSESEVEERYQNPKTLRKWIIRLGVPAILILIVLSGFWLYQRPEKVELIQPNEVTITETITSTGIVGGETETFVGAQSQGIVQKLFVREGDEVISGQQLALIKNDVAQAQISQAQSAAETARSQLVQVSRGALASDIEAARQLVKQANAQVDQQKAAIIQAEKNVAQTAAQLAQIEAEYELAKKNLQRSASLVEDGIVARVDHDQAVTTARVAEKKVEAQKRAIEFARSGVRSARSGLNSAQANVGAQKARLNTLLSGARPEDIRVAQKRVAETERAVNVARQLAGNAIVYAPFAGKVTKINAEPGQMVGATSGSQGVLTLVSAEPEIQLDVDENNLPSLRVGQAAIISSGAFSKKSFRGTVSELGAAVDRTRGTIEVKLIPINTPEWLRPGQTVDVSIITEENVKRLMVPQSALVRAGDQTVVYVVEDGMVAQKAVETRPLTKQGVPIVSGLEPADLIVKEAANLKVGDTVRAS